LEDFEMAKDRRDSLSDELPLGAKSPTEVGPKAGVTHRSFLGHVGAAGIAVTAGPTAH
jgi:hypothetical protein